MYVGEEGAMFFNIRVKGQINLFLEEIVIFPPQLEFHFHLP